MEAIISGSCSVIVQDSQTGKQPLLDNGVAPDYSAAFLRQLATGVAGLAWMVVSSGLILLNKHLMVVDGFKYPMALSGMGMGFSAIGSMLACRFVLADLGSVNPRSWETVNS